VIEPIQLSDEVALRLIRPEDAAGLADAYARNRTHLAPWDPARTPEFFTAAWHANEIPKLLVSYAAGLSVPLVFATNDSIVGRVNLSNIVRGAFDSGILGYWIDERYTGRGLVSAAVTSTVAVARGMGLHRVEAGTLVHNLASQRVLEKAGFESFGMAPKYLKINGSWQDHRLFQILLHG
jgi:[ribosomal protein S5]-alanine N-acetyltransferase